MEDRWVGLTVSLWMLGVSGMSPTFALYSPLLKAVAGYDQQQVETLAVAKDVGESVGFLPGLLCDFLPTWLLPFIGATHFMFGFGFLWLVAKQAINVPPFWMMFLVMLVGSQGTAWFNTATLVTNIRNFPKSRGTVVGLLKGLIGLSSAIFTQVYAAFLAPDQASFLGLIAFLPMAVVLPCMSFLRNAPRANDDTEDLEHGNLHYLMVTCLLLASYLSAAMIMQEATSVSQEIQTYLVWGMMGLLALPLWVPVSYAIRRQVEAAKARISSIIQEAIWNGPGNESSQPLLRRSDSIDSILADLSPTASTGDLQQLGGGRGFSVEGMRDEDGLKDTVPLLGDVEKAIDTQIDTHRPSPETRPWPIPEDRPIVNRERQLSRSFPDSFLASGNDVEPGQNRRATDDEALSHERIASDNAAGSGRSRVLTRRRSSKLLLAVGEGAVRPRRRGPRRGEDFQLSEAVRKADFWLVAVVFMCGSGTGLTAINNLAQMALAQGYTNVRIFVSLVSVWSFAGRLGGGYFSEQVVRQSLLPRPLLLLAAQLLMAVGFVAFAVAFPFSLHLGSIIVGLCYGVHWSVMPATVSELFGLRNFGILFNAVAAAGPLGSFLFSGVIAGYLYDLEAEQEGLAAKCLGYPFTQGVSLQRCWSHGFRLSTGAAKECHGAHCFRLTFFIMAGVCLVGALLSSLLVARTMRVYKALYSKEQGSTNSRV